jgi:hypothetical protein
LCQRPSIEPFKRCDQLVHPPRRAAQYEGHDIGAEFEPALRREALDGVGAVGIIERTDREYLCSAQPRTEIGESNVEFERTTRRREQQTRAALEQLLIQVQQRFFPLTLAYPPIDVIDSNEAEVA